MDSIRQDKDNEILVHWTYSLAEWRHFKEWERRRRGIVIYIIGLLIHHSANKIPYVVIGSDSVYANDARERFRDHNRHLAAINIIDVGKMNILEISFQVSNGQVMKMTEIRVPVPKGKLREAIELQDRLSSMKNEYHGTPS
jgi:hypothetical protein